MLVVTDRDNTLKSQKTKTGMSEKHEEKTKFEAVVKSVISVNLALDSSFKNGL